MATKTTLIVAGSFVNKTSIQLQHLLNNTSVESIELSTKKILSDLDNHYLRRIAKQISVGLSKQKSILVYTERNYALTGSYEQQTLAGRRIADFLAAVVCNLSYQPDLIISKGGITSHKVLTDGTREREALVIGQISPGVPILSLSHNSLFAGVYLIIFPGNVGDDDLLTKVFNIMRKADN